MKALMGKKRAGEISKAKPVAQDSDSDCGLEFEAAPAQSSNQKTFRDLLALKKVSYNEKFGKPTTTVNDY